MVPIRRTITLSAKPTSWCILPLNIYWETIFCYSITIINKRTRSFYYRYSRIGREVPASIIQLPAVEFQLNREPWTIYISARKLCTKSHQQRIIILLLFIFHLGRKKNMQKRGKHWTTKRVYTNGNTDSFTKSRDAGYSRYEKLVSSGHTVMYLVIFSLADVKRPLKTIWSG